MTKDGPYVQEFPNSGAFDSFIRTPSCSIRMDAYKVDHFVRLLFRQILVAIVIAKDTDQAVSTENFSLL